MDIARSFRLLVILVILIWPARAAAQSATPVITAPAAGQVLSGPVAITGATDILNFGSAEVSFAYASDSTNTWFRISATTQPVMNDLLASWDTTAISDGDYVLRLRVTLQDGTFQDTTVPVQVRNYTPLTTPTPTPAATATEFALQIPTPILAADTPTLPAPTLVPYPTPTPFPPNSAEVTPGEIYLGLQRGAIVIGILFLLFGIFLRLRRS